MVVSSLVVCKVWIFVMGDEQEDALVRINLLRIVRKIPLDS